MAANKFLNNAGLIEVLRKLKLTFSMLGHTHVSADITDLSPSQSYQAGTGLALSGNTFYTTVPKINNGNANSLVTAPYTVSHVELFGNNTPTAHWYHIITMVGESTSFATQIAFGLTVYGTYYRRYSNGAWSSWGSLYIDELPLSSITSADDLKAIEAISGTSGFLTKTATNTWSLDTSSYALSLHTHDNYVPTSRTVNNKALFSNISLTASDVGAITNEYRHITLSSSGWIASSNKYIQRVTKDTNNNNLTYTVNSTPILGKCASSSWTSAQMEAYNKAFNIVCRGNAVTGVGYVEFTVYSLPAQSIDVALKGA